ncbi:MAG TPA: DUF2470 domain-containing protein [Streptomyces sp.]|uniref:DUF2470 domain-containing protein n=1 Tax=Streptomyces sp. TaxID=1931 RepID=UPI002D4C3D86|nr:DUF2470 domain-containing protein [Streptomyces sp.]HZG02403.1 DUF2470 domain-containing protein [Streptomyces sp.]
MFRPGSPLSGAGPARDADRTDDAGSARSTGRGQPRPEAESEARRPSAAERMRTLAESNASAVLAIPGVRLHDLGLDAVEARAVTPRGDVFLLVPAGSPAARAAVHARGDDLAAVMEITDVAPVAVPHRIRGRARLAGWLTPVTGSDRTACAGLLAERHPCGPFPGAAWTPLRLEVGEGWIDDLWGEELVEPDDFAAAEPDPLARHEAELLQHLAAAHGDLVRGLCTLLGERARTCGARERVVPLALDRFGLRVRFCADGGAFDARFDFPRPVRDVTGLRRAVRTLFEAAAAD